MYVNIRAVCHAFYTWARVYNMKRELCKQQQQQKRITNTSMIKRTPGIANFLVVFKSRFRQDN